MELDPSENERLRNVLIAGAALLLTGATVRYVRDNEDKIKGYIYTLNEGKIWLLGAYRNTDLTEIVQISGGRSDEGALEIDPARINPDDVDRFEEVIKIASQNDQDVENPLQNK